MRILAFILCCGVWSGMALAQTQTADTPVPIPVREITGQVRMGSRPAPAGVQVALRVVFNRELIEADQEELVHVMTDAKGNFVFRHLEALGSNEGKELYQVSAVREGFRAAQQLMDLTENQRGEVTLDLQRITNIAPASRPAASVPGTSTAGPRLPRNPQTQEALDRAQELLFRKKDPEGSLVEFKKAIKLDPWYGPSYVLMGLANMQMQRWDSARLAFEEAIKVEPGNSQAFLGLGSALNEQRQFGAAQNALQHSLELKPESAEAHYELARALFSQNMWQAALPHAQKSVELNPDYPGPHALLGNIYVQAEDPEKALAEFRSYLRLEPEGSLATQAKEMISQLEKILAE